MIKLNKDNNGFAAAEVLLVVVILALIGAVGWFVYKDHHKSDTSQGSTSSQNVALTQTYIDTSGWFTLKYPSTWDDITVKAGTTVDEGPTGMPTVLTSNAAGQLVPDAAKNQIAALLNISTDSSTSTPEAYAVNTAGAVSQGKSETINGYSAYYDVITSSGDTFREFIVKDGSKIAVLTFTLTNGSQSFSSYQNAENSIANSIQFDN